ncbi:MAG: hypothetical protein KAG97_07185, partial [Victivallales bacterium]|nr:hypothetical protein [Victivallales bacterium]
GDVNTPSVAIVPPKKKHTPDPLKAARLKGDLIVKSLGDESFSIWQSCAGELKLSEDSGKRFTGSKSMKLDIKIDLKTDGGGEKGRYPVGWPRIRADFKDKELDLTKYEFLTFKVMIDSDRDEVADDYTPTYWTFASHVKNAKLPTVRLLGQVPQRVWIPVRIALNKLIAQNADLTPWKSIKMMQFGISEGKFADKTHLTFHIDDISLVSFKTPIIESVSAPSTFILPTRGINCRVGVLGAGFAKKSAYTVRLRLLDAENAVVADKTVALENAGSITLSPKRLTGGRYVLSAEIFDSKNKIVSTMKRRTVAVSGPASPLAPQPR